MHIKRLLFLAPLVLFLCFAVGTYAQEDLPRGLSPEEELMMLNGYVPQRTPVPNAITSPSGISTPRSIAEWEELQAIAITWTSYRDILAEIVRAAVKEVTVLIVTTNESFTRTQLEDRGIDPDSNIVFINSDYNSVWMRDYGPNPAYTSDVDSLVLVDWIYNRPRPKDDAVPAAIAEYLGVPMLSTTEEPYDLVNTGGNYMADGMGRAFSSELVLNENGPSNTWGMSNHDEGDIDAIMSDFMGINEYVKMDVLPYDGIHHIDMHMKLLNENTLLVGEYPEGIADGPQIEANIQYVIENFKQSTGRDYKVVRIPMPPDQFDRYPNQGGYYRTYANALFVNKTVLVPTYELQYDTTALRIWEETMPGYSIVGIDCNQMIPAGGAIHCITKEIGVNDPLLITHEPPHDVEYSASIELSATAKHRSGIQHMRLYTSVDGITYDYMDMTNSSGDLWTVQLANVTPSDTMYYYFEATATDGRTIQRPLVAPEGYFRLVVGENSTSTHEGFLDESDINIYPNPASAITCIETTLTKGQKVRISIIDMQGRMVQIVSDGFMPKGNNKSFFNARQFEPGMYIVRIETALSTAMSKVIVN